MSFYLELIRARFNQRNDVSVDPVPWALDDKETAYTHASNRNYRTPRRVRTATAEEALAAGNAMGNRFVVKQPNRHSTMGVYVLERIADGRYLDLFSLEEKTDADIRAVGMAPEYWLAEECLDSGLVGKPIPLDYKVYAFRGMITHIVQIDRNVYPPRVAVFDGSFIPLEPGKDYTTDPARWLLEGHVYPRHAGAILQMASHLSLSLQTRFVRVDCYDTPEGPVFGEFTFASGPDDVGMLRYSARILDALDRAMNGESIPPLSGFGASAPRGTSLAGPERVLALLGAGAIDKDTRYGVSVARYVQPTFGQDSVRLALALIGYLNGDRSRAYTIQNILRGDRFSRERLSEFVEAALDFHDARASSGNPWHAARAAEIRLLDGQAGALESLQALAEAGSVQAQRVLQAHSARSSA
ncbi:hypothetical protein FLP10_01505 [Agromyces intestinalis]|uniref:ATP-grasp domain-containing protein n=1 Tax=Agromyces intestinalis TaxID=2592652 RepID=A0A5C1YE08_9MICO|nr:ATP-grasp fold amidoligase family protein [Agromyces intestinalis]QEO13237.1 hypothetical protein FLP10_01505 [Agromyces intestinalis]